MRKRLVMLAVILPVALVSSAHAHHRHFYDVEAGVRTISPVQIIVVFLHEPRSTFSFAARAIRVVLDEAVDRKPAGAQSQQNCERVALSNHPCPTRLATFRTEPPHCERH